jgi:UrcA family protein
MKYSIAENRTTSIALAITSVFFVAHIAVAQEGLEKLVIQPLYEPIEVKNSSIVLPTLKPDKKELKRYVNIDDLDLTNPSDVTKLNARIKIVAKESCQRLSDMSPFVPSDLSEIRQCTKKAIKSTKQQIERIIAAAN